MCICIRCKLFTDHKWALIRTHSLSLCTGSYETINSTYYFAHKFNNLLVYKTCFSGYQPQLRICVALKEKFLVLSYRNENFIITVSIVYSIDI